MFLESSDDINPEIRARLINHLADCLQRNAASVNRSSPSGPGTKSSSPDPKPESVMQSLTIQQQQLQQQQQQQQQQSLSLQLPLTSCGLTSGQFILPSPTAAPTVPATQSTTFQTFPAVVPAGQMQLLPVWLSNGETVYILANAQPPPSVVPGSNVLSSSVTSVLSIQPLQRPDILATVDRNLPAGVSPLSTPPSWSDSSLLSTSGQSSDSVEFSQFVKRETGEPKNLFESKMDACANELPVDDKQMLDCNNNGDVNACLLPAWRPW